MTQRLECCSDNGASMVVFFFILCFVIFVCFVLLLADFFVSFGLTWSERI